MTSIGTQNNVFNNLILTFILYVMISLHIGISTTWIIVLYLRGTHYKYKANFSSPEIVSREIGSAALLNQGN